MNTAILAFTLVFLAELGDKTQLLTLILAARWRRTLPIVIGLTLASAVSHLGASLLGAALGQTLDPRIGRLLAGVAFIACALWMLWPEGEEGREEVPPPAALPRMILAAFSVYLLAELGDKTQFSSALLALQHGTILPVAGAATLAMLAANLPVLWLGTRVGGRLSQRLVRLAAALVFAALGITLLFSRL